MLLLSEAFCLLVCPVQISSDFFMFVTTLLLFILLIISFNHLQFESKGRYCLFISPGLMFLSFVGGWFFFPCLRYLVVISYLTQNNALHLRQLNQCKMWVVRFFNISLKMFSGKPWPNAQLPEHLETCSGILLLNSILLFKMSSSMQVKYAWRIYPGTANKGARIWSQ